MTYEQISALLSLLAAVIIAVINFYPWYNITYNGAPKVKKWGKIILSVCIALIIVSVVLLFVPKNNNENKDRGLVNSEIEKSVENNKKIELIYNETTGELYPLFSDNFTPHTCIWYISGDHGSDTVITTKAANSYDIKDSDYVGHTLSDNIESIKMNNFLPPRVPIYVSCVDYQNEVYSGSIGEY